MAPRLIVHAGLHKTGSTAIQRALGERLVPRQSIWEPAGNSDRMPALLASTVQEAYDRGLVISNESILGDMRDLYCGVESRLRGLRELDTPGTLLVYFRVPWAWHESIYAQLINEGETLTPDAYLSRIRDLPHFRLSHLAEAIATQSTPLAPVLRTHEDCLEKFEQDTGIRLDPTRRENVSMAPARVALARLLNEDDALRPFVRRYLQRRLPRLGGHGSVFTSEQQAELHVLTSDWSSVGDIAEQLRPGARLEFSQAVRSNPPTPKPWVGDSIDSPAIASEALGVIGLLINEAESLRPPATRGYQDKLRSSTTLRALWDSLPSSTRDRLRSALRTRS